MRGRTRRENPLYPVSFWNVKIRVDEDLPRTNNAVKKEDLQKYRSSTKNSSQYLW